MDLEHYLMNCLKVVFFSIFCPFYRTLNHLDRQQIEWLFSVFDNHHFQLSKNFPILKYSYDLPLKKQTNVSLKFNLPYQHSV